MPDWVIAETADDAAPAGPPVEEQLAAEQQMVALLKESYADLEALYREDIGWQRIGAEQARFTPEGRKRIAALADLSATGNALIKRGVNLRIAYIWGQGVDVTIRDDGATGQDVNAVWRTFWEDRTNRRAFTSSEAQARYERRLATGGEQFWALPTDPATGRVWIRPIPSHEIVERICDPEDAGQVWLYKRVWNAISVDREGRRTTKPQTTYYPELGFYPRSRPKTYQGDPIRWDAPMRPVTVNTPTDDWRGLGDVLAALPWSRMDKEFLEDLAVYMRALTRILGQATAKKSPARAAAADAIAAAGPGGWAVTDPGTSLQLVSKSGAQIDADSHKPFATMVASALEVPLTMLLGDPGVTGARATAETLDQPTELMARLRQEVHAELFRDIADYVIDQAVIAPRGPLRGAVRPDGDRLVVTLPEGDDRTVQVAWPEFDSTPLKDFVDAVAAAEDLPPLERFKLYAKAFKLENVEDLVEKLTDGDGNWLGWDETAGDVLVQRARRGDEPTDQA
ncbi:hypothetical protein QWY28_13290 [Nocardioides sp. SOB77]|uniref:Phage portal protein n=1 Tax=Nocardioides oceani TaxID=3058369 RepID=A0ABT8FGX0_9ACTN|nr:hypothetical protein [Nocardioides oceani]MDN4173929.1 hypothetical protein [Nocardioides oceani]